MMFGHLFVAVAVAVHQAPADSLISADSAMAVLRKGGYTIMWRHGATDHSVVEPMTVNTERFQQRNLTDKGVADSKLVGAIFKGMGIPVGDVIASPMYRTMETAQYAFGRATSNLLLRTLDPSADERSLILAQPAAGTNRMLVTHHFIIERNAPGIKPGDVAEGEAVVLKSDGAKLKTVAIIKMADWARLGAQHPSGPAATPGFVHGGARPAGGYTANTTPLVIPASLKTPKTAVAAEYLEVFNSADLARVHHFFGSSVVPNPARTMEERLIAYFQLKQELGNLSIVSVETSGDQIVVNANGSTGKPATITFTVEAAAPYRAKTINVQYKTGG